MERSSGTMLPIGQEKEEGYPGVRQPLSYPERPKVIVGKRLCLVSSLRYFHSRYRKSLEGRSQAAACKNSFRQCRTSGLVFLKRGRDQSGHIKKSPQAGAIRKDQFKLVEDSAVRIRCATMLLPQLPIASVDIEQIPVLAINGGGEIRSQDSDCRGRRVARAAGVGSEELFGDALFPTRRKNPLPFCRQL